MKFTWLIFSTTLISVIESDTFFYDKIEHKLYIFDKNSKDNGLVYLFDYTNYASREKIMNEGIINRLNDAVSCDPPDEKIIFKLKYNGSPKLISKADFNEKYCYHFLTGKNSFHL